MLNFACISRSSTCGSKCLAWQRVIVLVVLMAKENDQVEQEEAAEATLFKPRLASMASWLHLALVYVVTAQSMFPHLVYTTPEAGLRDEECCFVRRKHWEGPG